MADPNSDFFSGRNEAMLDRLLYSDFQRRLGGDLNEKQKERLVKTVRHYMGEVYENLGSKPVPVLNKEVLSAVVPDFQAYLRRSQGLPPASGTEDRVRMDTTNRFNQLQTERQEVRPAPPSAPDFRIALEDGPSTATSLFEQIKKQREAEAAREAASSSHAAQVTTLAVSNVPNPGIAWSESTDMFRQSATEARARDENALVERSITRQQQGQQQQMAPPPDPRAFFFGTQGSGLAETNPTVALPEAVRTRVALPQDIIKKQDDIVSYRENEYNLFLYSSDRDWVSNSTENRYNFSVNFDPGNNGTGTYYSTAAQIKFKNIVRIEFVKAILPTEGLEILATQESDLSFNTDLNVNILSFPYLMLRIPELDTNNFGTNPALDSSFGVLQYDGNWISDNSALNRAYVAMIPKFMKCQKVYYPTPLATLQKLTIQLQRPDGTLVSNNLDTLDISGFTISSQLTSWPTNPATTANTLYQDTSGCYIWVQTRVWFSKFMVSQGDRVIFKNVNLPLSPSTAQADFLGFIQKSTGHIVVNVGYYSASKGWVTGANSQGYCNYMIIRNQFADPTTGSEGLAYYGGSQGANNTFFDLLEGAAVNTGRFINMNHQTQVVLRVITRDMDSASRLRPDNLI